MAILRENELLMIENEDMIAYERINHERHLHAKAIENRDDTGLFYNIEKDRCSFNQGVPSVTFNTL